MSTVDMGNFQTGTLLAAVNWAAAIRVSLLFFLALPLVFAFSRWISNFAGKKYSPQHGMIAGKIVCYGGGLLILATLFHELGFSLAPLLGAAGIVGVALGFASQTSVSNVISGIFLVAEQPFVVGDIIRVGDTTGIVLSIDMLSVKLRQFDNRFVRIPNETLIKTEVTNITYFPIRRLDCKISVAYKEDLARVRAVLLEVAYANPLALQEPEPIVIFDNFGSSGIELLFAVWVAKADFLALKNSLHQEIKARFDFEEIEIPFPHLSLYTGLDSKPLPVELQKL